MSRLSSSYSRQKGRQQVTEQLTAGSCWLVSSVSCAASDSILQVKAHLQCECWQDRFYDFIGCVDYQEGELIIMNLILCFKMKFLHNTV